VNDVLDRLIVRHNNSSCLEVLKFTQALR